MYRRPRRRSAQHSFTDFRVRAATGGILAGGRDDQSAPAGAISSWASLRILCVRVAVRVEYSYKNRQDWLRIRSHDRHGQASFLCCGL